MKTDQLDYALPSELIAQHPTDIRSASRLLVLDRATHGLADSRFDQLLTFLKARDCLVLNDTKVLPARFFARRRTGANLEGLFLREAPSSRAWEVMFKGARKLRPNEYIILRDREQGDFCEARVVEKMEDGVCLLDVDTQADAQTVLEEIGFPPLPPYIRRDRDLARAQRDRQRYQTVYAQRPGAVAAPTAGLHFTDDLMAQLAEGGIRFARVTLHVGAGTFKPIATEHVEEHEIHREWYRLDEENAGSINAARRDGGRIVAVGTTVTRVLETVASVGWVLNPRVTPGESGGSPPGAAVAHDLHASEGTTNLFITPGYRFKVVDAMITNFHLPRSTLLALVAAFAGLEYTLAAYHHAIEQRYRFYSYGDAMLIL